MTIVERNDLELAHINLGVSVDMLYNNTWIERAFIFSGKPFLEGQQYRLHIGATK